MLNDKALELALSFVEDDNYLASVYKCFRLLRNRLDDHEKLKKIKSLNHVELATLEVLLDKIIG
jgi:hypothetical protein